MLAFHKALGEISRTAKAAGLGDLGDGHITFKQQMLRSLQAQGIAIFTNGRSRDLFEKVHHIIGADARAARDLLNGELGKIGFLDDALYRINDGEIGGVGIEGIG